MFEGEDERLERGLIFRWFEGKINLLAFLSPAGVPDLVIFPCLGLLKDGGAVRAEVEEDDAICVCGEAAAA